MLFDIVTLIIGVFLTVRKLDVKRREASEHPHVDVAAFEEWKATALRAYNLGSLACFGRLFLDYVLRFGVARVAPSIVIQVSGGTLFFLWVGCMVYTFVLSSRARGLQEKAKIVLLPAAPPPTPP
jgi:hypothetical protein